MFMANCIMKTPIKVAVTGAAGQIGYALLFRIASGQMFGPDQPLRLHLDENRARAQLAHKAGVGIGSVTNMTIWGNHSSTQYPDFYNARIDGRPANDVIDDEKWLKEEFIKTVQQRGAAVIKARGLSSAGSAANAIVDTVNSLTNDTPGNDWHSVAVCSDGSYYVEKGLICSFPFRVRGGKFEIVQDVPINDFSRAKIDASVAELKEEKSLVSELIS